MTEPNKELITCLQWKIGHSVKFDPNVWEYSITGHLEEVMGIVWFGGAEPFLVEELDISYDSAVSLCCCDSVDRLINALESVKRAIRQHK